MDRKTKSLYVLYLVNFVANTSFSVGLPLFPPLAKSKNIEESIIGYVYSLYPVGCILVSLILG